MSLGKSQNFPQNQLAVVDFGDYAEVKTSLTSDGNQINDAIDLINIDGLTNMSGAIATATSELGATSLSKNIILFTDGAPNSQLDTLRQAKLTLSQGIRLIAVGAGDANNNFLEQVTGDSSLTFPASFGNIEQAFQKVDQGVFGNKSAKS